MKILKTLRMLALGAVVLGANACNEAFIEPFDIENGGQLAANLEPPTAVAYLRGETSTVAFNVNLVENEGFAVSSITANIVLSTAAGSSSAFSLSVPASGDVSISTADLLSNTPVGGTTLTENTLNAGDNWVFSYVINMADGRSITPARTTTLTFTCPSDLAGTYNNFTDATHDFGAQQYNTVEEVTEIGSGRYNIPDMTGGVWGLAPYATVYGTSPRPTVLTEVCGSITVDDASDQFGGFITTAGMNAPTYNEANGVIQWQWVDTIYGETGVTTYTPQ